MAIDSCLQLLSAGLTDISVNQSVAAHYYAQVGYCVDKYCRLGYKHLVYADQTAIRLLGTLSNYGIEPDIVVPNFEDFQYDEHLLSYTPQLGYYSFQDEWPSFNKNDYYN